MKPSEMLELLVRMEKVLERSGRDRDVLRIRDVTVYRKEHRVLKKEKPIPLKPMVAAR